MKKKIWISLCAALLLSLALCVTASAARREACPVTMTKTWGSTVTITKFEVTSVEPLYSSWQNRLYFTMESDSFASLSLACYDGQGMPLGTVAFDKYDNYVDVPYPTATIEIMLDSPAANSDTLFYCRYINMYAPDGRAIGVTELQSPAYQAVGWYPEVTVFADDGRTLKISPFLTDAYAAVGWYTWDTALYRIVQNDYLWYKSIGDYSSILDLVDEYLPALEGTVHESSMYAIRTDAMDCWRVQSGVPFPSYGYKLGEDSIGTPEVSIGFTNVSYKHIVAFKVKFTCYNIFGNVESSYYDTFYCDDADMAPGESASFTWTLYGADSVHSVSNIRLTEVVFSDGTKWYR